MQCLAVHREIHEEGLCVIYMHIVVEKIREIQRLVIYS